MKTLFLLRHAKSSWDDPGLTDLQRPINKRGRKSAQAMARYFSQHHLHPPLVICSPSLRTRQTLDLLARPLDGAEIVFDDRIYEASRQTLLARIQELPKGLNEVLIIGHNPGLERLALHLMCETEDAPSAAHLREKYPTGTLTALVAPVDDWKLMKAGVCRLDAFVRPADLEAE